VKTAKYPELQQGSPPSPLYHGLQIEVRGRCFGPVLFLDDSGHVRRCPAVDGSGTKGLRSLAVGNMPPVMSVMAGAVLWWPSMKVHMSGDLAATTAQTRQNQFPCSVNQATTATRVTFKTDL